MILTCKISGRPPFEALTRQIFADARPSSQAEHGPAKSTRGETNKAVEDLRKSVEKDVTDLKHTLEKDVAEIQRTLAGLATKEELSTGFKNLEKIMTLSSGSK